MKKLTCLFLSLMIIIGSAAAGTYSAASSDNGRLSLEDFSAQVKELVNEYGSNSGIQTYSEASGKFETCRLIVKSEREIDTLNAASVVSGYKDLWILQFETEYDAASAYEYYSSLACIEYVEPDTMVKMSAVNTAPAVLENGHLSWGSEAVSVDEVLDYLEETEYSLSQVSVGIIDSGVDHTHEFFDGKLIDKGLNFSMSGDDTAMSDDPSSHGTHIAGILADNTPDSVKLKGYKIFDYKGETTDLLISLAVDRAVADGMDILNLSFGGNTSKAVEESFLNAYDSGVVLVAAAGNASAYIGESIPSSLDEAIVVAATNKDGSYANFSDYGDSIDIAAPGVDIYSTYNNNEYGTMSGTSMAAPFVAAGAAILLAADSELTPSQVEQALKDNAIPMNSPEVLVGSGMLNISEALEAERAAQAVADVSSGTYYEPITVTLTPAAGTKVYYTLDGSLPSESNGTLCTAPVTIDESCKFSWISVGIEESSVLRSRVQSADFRIVCKESESEFEIAEDGTLTAYNGSRNDIVVPDKINGITVVSLEKNIFSAENCPDLCGITLPQTVTKISDSAFLGNTSIEYVVAKGVQTVFANAFNGCASLKSIDAPLLKEIYMNAFKNCPLLSEISLENVERVNSYALFGNKSLSELKIPKLQSVGTKAFSNMAIKYAEFTSLKSFESSMAGRTADAFSGCDMLEEIRVPEVTTLGTTSATSGFNELNALKTFYAPKLEKIGIYAFYNCKLLENIVVDAVKSIDNFAFVGCKNLEKLYLPNAKTVGSNVFNDSGVNCIYFESAEEILSLPVEDSTVFIPSTATVIDECASRAHQAIYGTKGSYAEEWATGSHSYCTSEFIAIPAIVNDLPAVADGNILSIDAFGFKLSYQWYASIDGTTENSVAIDGATDKVFELAGADKYKGYYCVITSNDNGVTESVVSHIALNPNSSADYKAYNKAIESAPKDLSLYTDESVAVLRAALDADVSGKTLGQQAEVDAQTQAVLSAIAALELKKADYSALDAVLADIPNDLSAYTDESVRALQAVINSIDRNADITNQAQIDEYIRQINEAVANLKEKPVPTVEIRHNKGETNINYGDRLKLVAIVSGDAKTVWFVDGKKAGEGNELVVSPKSKSVTVTVKAVDKNGNVLKDKNGNEISDSQTVTVNTGIWQKIVSFFKDLFRINRTVTQALRIF